MLKDLLQKHDKDIFTDELVESINAIVKKEIDKQVNERVEKVEEENTKAKEDLEKEYVEKLETVKENYDTKEADMVKAINEQLSSISEEIHEANKFDYENIALVAESTEVLKRHKETIEKYNIETTDISKNLELEKELEESKSKFNDVKKQMNEIKIEKEEVEKGNIIKDVCEGISESQKGRIEKLSKSLIYESLEDFKEKVSDVKNAIVVTEEKVVEEKVVITEEKVEEVVEEILVEKKIEEAKEKKIEEAKKSTSKYDILGPRY